MTGASQTRHVILGVGVIAAAAIAIMAPPVPQPLTYHNMADQRPWLGIPNAWNVLSNLPFAIVGVLGLAVTLGPSGARTRHEGVVGSFQAEPG